LPASCVESANSTNHLLPVGKKVEEECVIC
jgi:hypothetical protein